MFEHVTCPDVDVKHVQTCFYFCSLSLSPSTTPPTTPFERTSLRQLHSCLRQNHALRLQTPLARAIPLTSRPPSLPRLWTLITRRQRGAQASQRGARPAFIQDQDANGLEHHVHGDPVRIRMVHRVRPVLAFLAFLPGHRRHQRDRARGIPVSTSTVAVTRAAEPPRTAAAFAASTGAGTTRHLYLV